MSLLDRIKGLFSRSPTEARGADDRVGRSDDAPRTGESSVEASLGLPTAPVVDPLGTPVPEAAPEPVMPPPRREDEEKS